MLWFLKAFGYFVMLLLSLLWMVAIVAAMYFVFIWPFCG